jgi:hypothetical protein
MSILLKLAQKSINESGLKHADVARRLNITPQKVYDFMKLEGIRGSSRVEQVLENFRPDILTNLSNQLKEDSNE